MKLLFDENLSWRLVSLLARDYPESRHVDQEGLHGRPDHDIWRHAAQHGFAIVSKDDDFRQLSFLHGAPPKVIRLVVGNAGTHAIAAMLKARRDDVAAFGKDVEASLLLLTGGSATS